MRRRGAAFPGIAPWLTLAQPKFRLFLQQAGNGITGTSLVAFQPATNCKALEIRQHAWGKLVGSLEPINRFAIAPGFQMAVGADSE